VGRIENAAKLNETFATRRPGGPAVQTDTSTMRTLASTALSTALGSGFPRGTKQALLVAWSTEAAAPLQLENETGRTQNVTLFVFRLDKALINRNPRRSAHNASSAAGSRLVTLSRASSG
jgi:hypothetical protein